MVSCETIISAAMSAIAELERHVVNADDYEFLLHPERVESFRALYPEPIIRDCMQGKMLLLGRVMHVDPRCPKDRFYLMMPIKVHEEDAHEPD